MVASAPSMVVSLSSCCFGASVTTSTASTELSREAETSKVLNDSIVMCQDSNLKKHLPSTYPGVGLLKIAVPMLRQVFAYYSLSKALLLKMKQRIQNDVRLIKGNVELN